MSNELLNLLAYITSRRRYVTHISFGNGFLESETKQYFYVRFKSGLKKFIAESNPKKLAFEWLNHDSDGIDNDFDFSKEIEYQTLSNLQRNPLLTSNFSIIDYEKFFVDYNFNYNVTNSINLLEFFIENQITSVSDFFVDSENKKLDALTLNQGINSEQLRAESADVYLERIASLESNDTIEIEVAFGSINLIKRLYKSINSLATENILEELLEKIIKYYLKHLGKTETSTIIITYIMLLCVLDRRLSSKIEKLKIRRLFDGVFYEMLKDANEYNLSFIYYHFLFNYWHEISEALIDFLVNDNYAMFDSKCTSFIESIRILQLLKETSNRNGYIFQFEQNEYDSGDLNVSFLVKKLSTMNFIPIKSIFESNQFGLENTWLTNDEIQLFWSYICDSEHSDLNSFAVYLNESQERRFKSKKYYYEDLLLNTLKRKYSFRGFIHCTDILNLNSIFFHRKLFSRHNAKRYIVVDAADKEIINNTPDVILNSVRFFYRDKTPTLYANEGVKKTMDEPHMPIPVLLIFDESIIYYTNKLFYNGGAANSRSRSTKSAQVALNFPWEQIFYKGPVPNGNNDFTEVFNINDGRLLTSKKNSEFLIYDSVSIDKMNKLIFRSPAELKMFELIKDTSLQITSIVDNSSFNNRVDCDYLYDFKIEVKKDSAFVGLMFYRFLEDFKHNILITFDSGICFTENIRQDKNNSLVSIQPIPESMEKFDFYGRIDIDIFEKIYSIEIEIEKIKWLIWRKDND
jgi:hypothetical protein